MSMSAGSKQTGKIRVGFIFGYGYVSWLGGYNYFRNLILYIHLNPDKHGIDNYSEYPFSSYKSYLSDKPSLLEKELVLNYFDNKKNFIYCHKQYKDKLEISKVIEDLDY